MCVCGYICVCARMCVRVCISKIYTEFLVYVHMNVCGYIYVYVYAYMCVC